MHKPFDIGEYLAIFIERNILMSKVCYFELSGKPAVRLAGKQKK